MNPKTAVFPNWRGIQNRPAWGDFNDVCRNYDSRLAAECADQIVLRELGGKPTHSAEVAVCWGAAFRGALRGLNENLWALTIHHLRKERFS